MPECTRVRKRMQRTRHRRNQGGGDLQGNRPRTAPGV